MTGSEACDPTTRQRIHDSFNKQGLMGLLRASLIDVAPGIVEIELDANSAISQQHGFVHAGAVAAIADTAAGYAALTLMPWGRGVLTTEFKINLLSPAQGRLRARAKVIKCGKTLTLAQTEVVAADSGKLIAFLTATLMAMENREGISD